MEKRYNILNGNTLLCEFVATQRNAEEIFSYFNNPHFCTIFCVTDNEDVTQKFLASDD